MAEWIAQARRRILPYWRSLPVFPYICGFILGFLLSVVHAGLCPFSTALCAAFWISSHPLGALCGAVCASLLFSSHSQAFVLIILGIFILAEKLLAKRWTASLKLTLLCISWCFAFPLYFVSSTESIMSGLGNLSLSLFACICMTGAIRSVRQILRERVPASSDLICLCIFLTIICYSLQSYSFAGISPGAICASLFVLLIASCRGVETAAAAVMFSSGCIFAGAEPALAGNLAICALCACAARSFGKWGCAVSFVAVSFLLYAFVSPSLHIADAGLAALIYCCITRRIFLLLPSNHIDRARSQSEAALSQLRRGVGDMSDVLREVAPLFRGGDGFAQRQILAVSEALSSLSENRKPVRRAYDIQIGAAALAKPGSEETGDSMGMRRIRQQLVLLLSDGMGSGGEAHKESAAAVALLGDLLCIGFALSEALECVNRLLMQRSDANDMFATMDALLFDLSSGQAQFVKYGAPPSYILRNGKVHTLYAEALPAGIVSEACPALHTASLRKGDAVVLMTDGAYDALGSELSRALIDRVGSANTADDAAQSLLLAAREKNLSDDMTVIVARIA